MANIYEEISKSHAQGGGKTDANLANDANHLGGVPAEQYATKKYVQDYHNTKESAQKEYIDEQDAKTLQDAKEYTNSQIRNQDFSTFAKLTDVQAVNTNLTNKIEACGQQCATNLATRIKAVVDDTNANFDDVNDAIGKLNSNQNDLFQSVSSGKARVAAAITDKGVNTASDASYDTMAGNIRSIQTGGGDIDENFVNTSDGTATASDILLGKTAYVQGQKIYGGLLYPETEDSSDATATPYDILQGKTAYVQGRKIQGILNVDENSRPSYDIGAVEKIYGTVADGMINEHETYPREKTNYSINGHNEYTLLKKSDENTICAGVFCRRNETTGECEIETALYETYLGVEQFVNKKRYTLDELGIDVTGVGNELADKASTVPTAIFSSSIVNNEAYLCLYYRYINLPEAPDVSSKLYVYKLKFVTEHTGNSIGIDYLEIDTIRKWKHPFDSTVKDMSDLLFSENNTNKLCVLLEIGSSDSGYYRYIIWFRVKTII